MKICTRCKVEKEFSMFHKNPSSKNGYQTVCKACVSIRLKAYYKSLDNLKKEEFKITTKKSFLKRRYGLTPEKLDSMYALQNGECLICKTKKETYSTPKGLLVDHCHATGKVRGLLCNSCNMLLGLAKDNTEILQRAIAYINVHKRKGD